MADSSAQPGQLEYFDYLKSRSWKALLYRRVFLYPRLGALVPGRVLDVGCGVGDFLAYHGNACGIDVNPRLVEYCQRRGLNASLIHEGRYPFEAESFDAVVLDNVLEHLTDPTGTLREIRRVLVASGRLLVGVPGRKGFASDPDHKRFYDLEDLDQVMGKHGFQRVTHLRTPLGFLGLHHLLRQGCLYALFTKR